MSIDRKGNNKVAIICPYPEGIAPGQRFRFELFLDSLSANGFHCSIYSFLDTDTYSYLYRKGFFLKKAMGVLKGYFRRVVHLFRIRDAHFVLLHREAAPLGPPVFEWLISRVMKKKMIYDFDDAIWLPTISKANKLARQFKWYSKVATICKWSAKISVGNDYLAAYASKYNNHVVVIPSVVDTDATYNVCQNQSSGKPHIGWSGTFSTVRHLQLVLPSLQELQQKRDFVFFVIADIDPRLPLKNYRYIKWQRDSEVADLLNFHVGLMPLIEDEYSYGKGGFKAIQYMSLGIPAVVSPIGVNKTLVDDGVDGYHCGGKTEWTQKLECLLDNHERRSAMGKAARQKIVSHYSMNAIKDKFIELFS